MQKSSHHRTVFDIKMLARCTESVKFFADMLINNDYTTHEQCCRVMIHKFYHGQEVVFYEGTVGSTFYIILKGSVGVYIPEKKTSNQVKSPELPTPSIDSPRAKRSSIMNFPLEHATSFKFKLLRMNTHKEEKISSSGKITSMVFDQKNHGNENSENPERVTSLTSARLRDSMTTPLIKERMDQDMTRVKILTQGMAFGELALLDNKPRAATIICEEDCHFAILEKKSFLEILSISQTK